MEHAPLPLPSAESIAARPPGVWTLRGASHQVATPGAPASGPLKLLLQCRGRAELRQAGRRTVLSAGQFSLVDGALPFSMHAGAPFEQVLVTLPRAMVAARHPSLLAHPLHLHGERAEERLVLDFVQSVARQAPGLAPASLWQALSALMALLGGLELRPAHDRHAALLQQALALIDLEIAEIDAEGLAARLGVSRRHLDAVFSRGSGRSLGEHLWERRLSLAADQLRRPDAPSITEVAHAVGFKDSSHFARAFRRRHGLTPSAWRRLRAC
jgi:AraC-like DNA-binding protein